MTALPNPKNFFFNIDLLQNYNLWLSKGDLAIRGCICGFLHACLPMSYIFSYIYSLNLAGTFIAKLMSQFAPQEYSDENELLMDKGEV